METKLPRIVSDDYIKPRGRPVRDWPAEWFSGKTWFMPTEFIHEFGYSSAGSFRIRFHQHCDARNLSGHTSAYPDGIAIRADVL